MMDQTDINPPVFIIVVDQHGHLSLQALFDFAKVTRVSNDAWTIEPANYSGVTFANARLIDGNDNSIGLGYYKAPFRLTLTRTTR
jgi:hypothetical protein